MNTSTQENKQVLRDKKGRFLKGVSGHPDGCPKGVKKKTFIVRDYVFDLFDRRHLKTGKFEEWVEHSPRNKEKFYEWVIKGLPKETEISGKLESGEAKIVIITPEGYQARGLLRRISDGDI